MTLDFGYRTRPRTPGVVRIITGVGGGVGAVAVVLILGAGFLRARMLNLKDMAAYGVSGTPCPQTTLGRLAVDGPQPRETFDYGGMRLRHASGEADCAWVSDDNGLGFIRAPTCRFTSPGALVIEADGRTLAFATGIGRSAAVVHRQGRVVCRIVARSMTLSP